MLNYKLKSYELLIHRKSAVVAPLKLDLRHKLNIVYYVKKVTNLVLLYTLISFYYLFEVKLYLKRYGNFHILILFNNNKIIIKDNVTHISQAVKTLNN